MADLVAISLGAGVQSTTLYLMACLGEIEPRPSVAIFADTGAEPDEVYAHLWWLVENFGHVIPVCIVTAGDLEADMFDNREGRKAFASIPLHVLGEDGKPALLHRQCTREYKIAPVNRELRSMLGLVPRQRAAGVVEVEEWVGISLDEIQRMKPSRDAWVNLRWPLIEKRMTRRDCSAWIASRGYPPPPKSACYFCPFHNNADWRRMRDTQPELWTRAVAVDRKIRPIVIRGNAESAYLHGSLMPLDQAPIDGDDRQLNLFGNECEGMCGV